MFIPNERYTLIFDHLFGNQNEALTMLNNWSLDLFLNLNFALKTKKFDPTTLCYLDVQSDNVVVFFVFSELRWKAIVLFVGICGIADYHCVNSIFMKSNKPCR